MLHDIHNMRQKGTKLLDRVSEVQEKLGALHKKAEKMNAEPENERDDDPQIFWIVQYQVKEK